MEGRVIVHYIWKPVILILFLAACASDPLVRWGQGQQLYNAAMTEIIRYREPCVVGPKWPDGGSDHRLCFIDNETMAAIGIARDNTRELLDRTRIAAEVGNNIRAEDYMFQAEAALEDLLFYQLRAASQAGEN